MRIILLLTGAQAIPALTLQLYQSLLYKLGVGSVLNHLDAAKAAGDWAFPPSSPGRRPPISVTSEPFSPELNPLDSFRKWPYNVGAKRTLVRRGVCARHRPLSRNVERRRGIDQARPAQGFAQSGWGMIPAGMRPTRDAKSAGVCDLRCAVPKLNQWGQAFQYPFVSHVPARPDGCAMLRKADGPRASDSYVYGYRVPAACLPGRQGGFFFWLLKQD